LFSSLAAEADSLVSNGVRLRVIGDLGPFGTDVLHLVQDTERRTASNHKLELVIAVNYGGRWDIVSACRRLAMKAVEGKLSCDAIDEQCVSEALSTSTLPDPDLCIRTGGEYRISNFLLWQLAYTELYFTETLWPEFTEDDFVEALNWYATRQRRFGKIQEQVRVS
jgi:undecaprenyl diphosphate synthase